MAKKGKTHVRLSVALRGSFLVKVLREGNGPEELENITSIEILEDMGRRTIGTTQGKSSISDEILERGAASFPSSVMVLKRKDQTIVIDNAVRLEIINGEMESIAFSEPCQAGEIKSQIHPDSPDSPSPEAPL